MAVPLSTKQLIYPVKQAHFVSNEHRIFASHILPVPDSFKMLERAIQSDAVWVYFTPLPMTTQLSFCCKTGCGGVDSCYIGSYSDLRSSTVDRSWTPQLRWYVCGWEGCMRRPESDCGENWVSDVTGTGDYEWVNIQIRAMHLDQNQPHLNIKEPIIWS